ncbi:MAG: DUF3881 family protein [Acidobacteriota bacterium]
MGTTFDAVGFSIADDEAYNQLAEHAGEMGSRSTIYRRGARLHGCCFKLGQGLEIWTVLYESEQGLFYADCRPAFRPDHITILSPWELTEYDEDGEAVVRGFVEGTQSEIVFELQNLTELDTALFRRQQLSVALAGLGYSAHTCARRLPGRFLLTEKAVRQRQSCENDYTLRGRVLSCRYIKNPMTNSQLLWAYLDTGSVKLEVVVNANDVRGEVKLGGVISASVWLQGYIFDDDAIAARYEGVDRTFQQIDFWASLRREN